MIVVILIDPALGTRFQLAPVPTGEAPPIFDAAFAVGWFVRAAQVDKGGRQR